jgi:formylglycine-generating enzyme required for sulfatase activity
MSLRAHPRLAAAVALFVLSALAAPALTQAPKGKKHALLVGVREYRRSTLFPGLKYTENDVEKLAALLRSPAAGFATVRVLTTTGGEKDPRDAPTAANVRRALADLIEDRGPRDTVVIALSGHGVQLDVDDPDGNGKPRNYSYFCPHDADLVNVSYSTGRSRTLLLLDDVFGALGRCGAGVKLVLMDACRNEMKAGASARGLDTDGIRIPSGVGALFSCSAGQKAFETERLAHGVFFHYVIEGLRGAARNSRGEVTWARLTEYVTEKVTDEVTDLVGGGARQTPHPFGNIPGKSPVLIPARVLPQQFDNSLGMKLVRIPAGKFVMGSTKPERDAVLGAITDRGARDWQAQLMEQERPHEVTISRPFYMGSYEVTQKQYRAVMGRDPSHFAAAGEGRDAVKGMNTDDFPVESVSWAEAEAFCKALSARAEEKQAGWLYRLPTEAEWEYACRAGTRTPYHHGDTLGPTQANFGSSGVYRTTKVGSYRPNAFGLYDMHGNVSEWCADWYEKGHYGAGPRQDPRGPAARKRRVCRGGSWYNWDRFCRAAIRDWGVEPEKTPERSEHVGFRVVCVPAGRAP